MFINPESKQHPTKKDFYSIPGQRHNSNQSNQSIKQYNKKDFIQFLVMRNIAFLEMEKLSLPKQERRLR